MNHSFDVELATRYGVQEAIFIENVRFWVLKNKANNKHFYKGKYWTYNSAKAYAELFPYWSKQQIERIISKLKEAGILVVDHFSTNHYDRTNWYTLNEEMLSSKSMNGNVQIDESSNTDVKPNTVSQQVVNLYHEILPELPSVQLMTEKRKKLIAAFIAWVQESKKSDGTPRATNVDEALVWTRAYFDRARDNDFLMARDGTRSGSHANWKCDLEFLLSEKGRVHVIEKTG